MTAAAAVNLADERLIRDGEIAAAAYAKAGRENILPMARGLIAARRKYKSNQEFGRWFDQSPYRDAVTNHTMRAALIYIGEHEAIATSIMADTGSAEPEAIAAKIKAKVNSENLKTPKPKRRRKGAGKARQDAPRVTPKTDEAYEMITKALAEGRELPGKKEMAKATGISHMAIEKAWDRIQREQEQADAAKNKEADTIAAEDRWLAAANFSEKSKATIADALRIYKARIDKQAAQTIREEVRRQIDAANDATRANNKKLHLENIGLRQTLNQQALLTLTEFRILQKVANEDFVFRFKDAEMTAACKAAAQVLNAKKKRLIGDQA